MINLMLLGNVHAEIVPILYAAHLIALTKKDGGLCVTTAYCEALEYPTQERRVEGSQGDRDDKQKIQPIIIVHGGAGDIANSKVQGKLDGVKLAVIAGQEVLNRGGSALDAVEAAVVSMEKDDNFNAGYGSVLNLRGEVEMEASMMSGTNLDVGAVTLIKDFPHPISIAHKVLTESPHAFLGGEGAKLFALEKGFTTVPPESLISGNAREALRKFLVHGELGRAEDEGGVGTVGAVAIDAQGSVAVATSTGGINGKAVGRIGDTPQIGSGSYADDKIGGVSITGHGESILKFCLAHSIIKLMEDGANANTATMNAVNAMTARLNNTAGVITLSNKGEVGIHFSSNRMSWAYVKDNKIFYGIEHGQVLEEPYK
ncbi:isoaspartyl peptidase/L-asparaginase-like [Hyposmocoma kahamanoa]|uniref:isoaspartyl peptidase/L-asparaginase-like n=1 Tax=Hyposmocoma kahamanoa TaxID=1477025 RepID=UPI000E6D5D6C|nr:isoaspartyl peptidase/L-asparaginase-like [Hyposmocoma kahamanoa]